MGNFKTLRVWQDSMDLCQMIYEFVRTPAVIQDFALRNQITRSAISIPSNIAEGDERGTNRQSVHFFNIALGSAAEVITQLNIANRIGYLTVADLQNMENLAEKIRASLKKLIQARNTQNPVDGGRWTVDGRR